MDIASELIEQYLNSGREQIPTIILVAQGEFVFSRDCFLETRLKFFPLFKRKTPVKDYLQVHISGAVLHILPEMFELFLSELQRSKDLTSIFTKDFIQACMQNFSDIDEKQLCNPIDPEHKLDHAESEYNWSIAEPFFLTHQLDENDLHSYKLKPEYKDIQQFSKFDTEIYCYIDNWIEARKEKIDLKKIKAWKKILGEPENKFSFSHTISDKMEIKAYFCSMKDGRLVKTSVERLSEIPCRSIAGEQPL